jgi:hypothetical protein
VTTTTATSKTATTTTTTTTTTSGTTTSVTYTTQMECTTGEFRDPRTNTCKPCAEGTYRPDSAHTIATCIAHSTCKGHEFVLVKPTASSNVHCASSELCNAGEWESTPPKQGEVKCAFSRQKFALEDAIEFHAFAPLEASMRVTNGNPLGWPLL